VKMGVLGFTFGPRLGLILSFINKFLYMEGSGYLFWAMMQHGGTHIDRANICRVVRFFFIINRPIIDQRS
jgi:hypothetical protein